MYSTHPLFGTSSASMLHLLPFPQKLHFQEVIAISVNLKYTKLLLFSVFENLQRVFIIAPQVAHADGSPVISSAGSARSPRLRRATLVL